MKVYKINNATLFISSIKDTRYLLIYPNVVQKLYSNIETYGSVLEDLLRMTFSQLIDFRLLNPPKEAAKLMETYSNLILLNQFPKNKCIDVMIMQNANIPPLSNTEKDDLIAQTGIPFSSDQLLVILSAFPENILKDMLDTLLSYQIKDIASSFTPEQLKSLQITEEYIGVF